MDCQNSKCVSIAAQVRNAAHHKAALILNVLASILIPITAADVE
jgi:hypothetical protein